MKEGEIIQFWASDVPYIEVIFSFFFLFILSFVRIMEDVDGEVLGLELSRVVEPVLPSIGFVSSPFESTIEPLRALGRPGRHHQERIKGYCRGKKSRWRHWGRTPWKRLDKIMRRLLG